jgi:hypothetical protein
MRILLIHHGLSIENTASNDVEKLTTLLKYYRGKIGSEEL